MTHKLFKLGAAAALTLTGISTATSFKTVSASSFVALKRVKINYLPGKGLKIWTSYNNGEFMGFRAKDGTEWNVAKTALDKDGNLWYKVGTREWIQARYTVDVDTTATKDTQKKTKAATVTKTATTTTDKTAQSSSAQKTPKTTAKPEEKTSTAKTATTKTSVIKKTIAKVKKASTATKTTKAAKTTKTATKTTATKTAAKSNKSASTQASSRANAIVALAKQEVGKPYVWAGASEDGFDCSGLVQYVYSHAAGINMPRTTYDQVKVGTTVSMDQLQAGDLIYWGDTSAPYHVAIYIGNNQYVNAATPEQGVILQTLTSYYYPSIAKRVL